MSEEKVMRPHVGIINCQLEISYLLDSGEVSGQCVNTESIKKLGLKPNFIIAIHGKDLDECVQNIKDRLKRLENE